MITEALFVVLSVAAGGLAYARHRRGRLYRSLEARIRAIQTAVSLDLDPLLKRAVPLFDQRLARIDHVLPGDTLEVLRTQALALAGPERSYIPTHKKGGTVAYESLFETAPAIVAIYHSRELQGLLTRIVGEAVRPTPVNDQSSLSVLFYEKPGDHIGWHYDHNFYRGRHFTVLLPVINEGSAAGGLSHAMLKAKIQKEETDIATPPNALIVFEGAKVHHKVTPILEGERRLVISMTYCTDPRANALQGAVRRIKDVAFFGPRALWT
jgi:hypothetical protein